MARVLGFLSCWLLCSLARADVFVVAPPYFEGSDGERVADEIVRAVEQDLISSQHKVLGPKEAAARVSKEHRVWCRQGACAERYREATGAAAAIVVRVARAGGAGEGPATSFQLGIQPALGLEYTAGGLVGDGPLTERVVKALREAFRGYRQGPGPWLEVTGAPEGASVFVNDAAVGTLPCTLAVPLGTVRIRVEAQTFVAKTDVVSMRSATDRRQLEFRLEPESALKGPRIAAVPSTPTVPVAKAPTESPTKLWRGLLYGGVGVAVVGAVIGGLGIADKVRDGDCSRHSELGCTERYAFGTAGRLKLGGGVSLALVGATLGAVGGWKMKTTARADIALMPNAVALSVGGQL